MNDASKDVSINKYKKHNVVGIVFRNNIFKRITKTNYVMFGLEGDRLYFLESNEYTGYKLSDLTYNKRRIQVSASDFVKVAKAFFGDHDLKCDSQKNMYYIEKKEEY